MYIKKKKIQLLASEKQTEITPNKSLNQIPNAASLLLDFWLIEC